MRATIEPHHHVVVLTAAGDTLGGGRGPEPVGGGAYRLPAQRAASVPARVTLRRVDGDAAWTGAAAARPDGPDAVVVLPLEDWAPAPSRLHARAEASRRVLARCVAGTLGPYLEVPLRVVDESPTGWRALGVGTAPAVGDVLALAGEDARGRVVRVVRRPFDGWEIGVQFDVVRDAA